MADTVVDQASGRGGVDRDRVTERSVGGRGHLFLRVEGGDLGLESGCGCMGDLDPVLGVSKATSSAILPEVVASEAEVALEVVERDET